MLSTNSPDNAGNDKTLTADQNIKEAYIYILIILHRDD